MSYKEMAQGILSHMGGLDNISYMTNCATRLRLNLKDESKGDLEGVKTVPGVVGAVKRGGVYQIIIGTDVSHVLDEIKKMGPVGEAAPTSKKEKGSLVNRAMGMISGVFTPIIPALIAGGMLKALLTLLTFFKVVDSASQTYYMVNFIADTPFYFLPVLTAISTARKLNCNVYIAASIGAALLHPKFTALVSAGEAVKFVGLPVTLVSYSSSIIPSILAVWLMSYIEPFADKISPKPIKFLSKPLITILVVAPITFIVLGPIGYTIGCALATGAEFLNTNVSWLVPTLMGAFMPLLVMTGMHWGFAPAIMQSYATYGYEAIMGPGSFVSNICQGAASLAVAFKTKNKELRQVATSAGITALLGVTEPAMFGVTLRLKKPLYAVIIGGACGGLYAGINGVVRYTSGTPGLASFAVFIGENPMNIVHAFISVGVGAAITFVLTLVFGWDDPAETGAPVQSRSAAQETKIEVASPVAGQSIKLSDVKDETFASEVLGKGAAVQPKNGKVYAPSAGKILTVPETGHAVSMVDANGAELLIHVGIDTVKLEGKYFTVKVKPGDMVKAGDLLLEFDKASIEKEGYDSTVVMIVTNTSEFLDVIPAGQGSVDAGQTLFTIV